MTRKVIVARHFNKPPVRSLGIPAGYSSVWLADTEMLDPADDPFKYEAYNSYDSRYNELCLDAIVAETEDQLIELLRGRIGEPFEELSWIEKGSWYRGGEQIECDDRLTKIKAIGVYAGLIRLDREKLGSYNPEREQELGRLVEAAASTGGVIVTWKDRELCSESIRYVRELLDAHKIRRGDDGRWRYTPTARSIKIRCPSDKAKLAERAGRLSWDAHVGVMVRVLDAAINRKYAKGYKGDTPSLTVAMFDPSWGMNSELDNRIQSAVRRLTGLMAMLYIHARSFYSTKEGKEIGKSIAPYMAGLVRRYCRLCSRRDGIKGIELLMSWSKYFPVIKGELAAGYREVMVKKERQRLNEEKRRQQAA